MSEETKVSEKKKCFNEWQIIIVTALIFTVWMYSEAEVYWLAVWAIALIAGMYVGYVGSKISANYKLYTESEIREIVKDEIKLCRKSDEPV